jgi:hypothetical protein
MAATTTVTAKKKMIRSNDDEANNNQNPNEPVLYKGSATRLTVWPVRSS